MYSMAYDLLNVFYNNYEIPICAFSPDLAGCLPFPPPCS
jgi:hypothetical protein